MNVNWFIVAGGVLWLMGAVQAYLQGNARMAIVSVCYAIAQLILAQAR